MDGLRAPRDVPASACGARTAVTPRRPTRQLEGHEDHGQAERRRAVRRHPGARRGRAVVRGGRGQPEPRRGRRAPALRHRLGACAARGDRRLRGRRRGPDHRAAGRLRRLLRARQSAPHQRALRRPPLHGARPRSRLADPLQRDRPRLLPGDPPRPAVPRVQPLQRADLQPPADAPAATDRHPARGRPGRGERRVAAGRHRRSARARAGRRERAGHLPAHRPPR